MLADRKVVYPPTPKWGKQIDKCRKWNHLSTLLLFGGGKTGWTCHNKYLITAVAPAGVSLSLSLRLSVACCTAYLAHFFLIFWPTAAAHLAHIRNELRNDFRYLLLRTGKLKKNWIWQNVWPTSSRVESSRVASIGVKKMKNNCTALARQLPDFYGKQLFFFISHPLHSLALSFVC